MFLLPGNIYNGFIFCGNNSINISLHSHKKLPFRCKCGRINKHVFGNITKGAAKSCGLCTEINLIHGTSYKGLIYIGPTVNIHPNSSKKLDFKCKCGNVVSIRMYSITNRNTGTCGKCSVIHLNTNDKYFCFTYAGAPIDIKPN